MNKKLLCFLFTFFIGYVSCAVGAEIMPEEYIVTINGIKMHRSSAEKLFKNIKRSSSEDTIEVYDVKKGKNTMVSTVKKELDVTIKNNLMTMVSELYQACLYNKNNKEECEESCEKKVCVYLCVDRNEELVTDLEVYRK